MPLDFNLRPADEEALNALVVEDSPQIAERLVELDHGSGATEDRKRTAAGGPYVGGEES